MESHSVEPRPTSSEEGYRASVEEARALLRGNPESSPETRLTEIHTLIEKIYTANPADEKDIETVAKAISQLLGSSPLTDQQAGVIMRTQMKLDLQRTTQPLTEAELLIIQAGDWEKISQIFGTSPERQAIWKTALESAVKGTEPNVVYRGMKLTDEEARLILKYGMIPNGLKIFGQVETLIAEKIKEYWGAQSWSHLDQSSILKSMLSRLPFSKVNVLRDVNEFGEGEFNLSNPFNLGMSTSTPENVRQINGSFFGNYLFKIELPAEKLVPTLYNAYPYSELVVLSFIPPEAISLERGIARHPLRKLMSKFFL